MRKRTPFCHLGVAVASLTILLSASGSWAGQPDTETLETIDLPVPGLCFAQGTPLDVVNRTLKSFQGSIERNSLAPPTFSKHRIADSWYATATDGSGLAQGDPITLTWSVVPDGMTIPGSAFVGDTTAPSNLKAFLTGIYGNEAAWLAVFQQVFDRWEELTGISYVYEPSDDGASWTGAAGLVGVRGDIRISGHRIDGNSGILAYNFYPSTGDMVIDTADSFFSNTLSNSLRLRNVVAHEHGHGLGFGHVCPVNQTKLMEPFISSLFDGPQHDDILAANRSYGDRFEHDDTSATAAPLGAFGSTTEANLSVDDNTDTDVYSFIVNAVGEVDITVTPMGTTYLEGPQNSNGSCTAGSSYNTLTIQDLEIRVLDVDGVTQLAASDMTGVGGSEVLEDVALTNGAGTYFVEVTGDSTNDAQLYQLSMTVSPSDGVFAEGFESGDLSTWSSSTP